MELPEPVLFCIICLQGQVMHSLHCNTSYHLIPMFENNLRIMLRSNGLLSFCGVQNLVGLCASDICPFMCYTGMIIIGS